MEPKLIHMKKAVAGFVVNRGPVAQQRPKTLLRNIRKNVAVATELVPEGEV